MICEGLSEEEKGGRRWKPYFLDDLMRTLAYFFPFRIRFGISWPGRYLLLFVWLITYIISNVSACIGFVLFFGSLGT